MPAGERLALAECRALIARGEAAAAAQRLRGLSVPPALAAARDLFEGIALCHQARHAEAAGAIGRAVAAAPGNQLAKNWAAVVRARRGELAGAVRDLLSAGLMPFDEILIELSLIFENHLLCHPERRPPTGLDPAVLRAMGTGDLRTAPPPRRLSPRAFERAYTGGDFHALLRHAAHALARPSLKSEGRMVVIHCLHESGLAAEALAMARDLAAALPGAPEVQSQLGLAAIRAGDLRAALEALARVRIEGPEDFNCHCHLGLAALRAGDEAEARRFFTKAFHDYFIGTYEDSWARLWRAITSDHFLREASL